jgi:hypothetical protein
LLGAGMESAKIAIECKGAASTLVWVDDGKIPIDETSGLIEGALDAIENRIARARAASARVPARSESPAETPPISESANSSAETSAAPDDSASARVRSAHDLEGGVSLAIAGEIWSGSVPIGPRLDVGLSLGRGLALVVSEGARFAAGTATSSEAMVFDLQSGLAYGAPFQTRTGFGVALLGGAERLSISSGRFSDGGMWIWTATASLGLRGSVSLGAFDIWAGVDGIVRSATAESGGPAPRSIPSTSFQFSLGGFLPAFGGTPATDVASR